MLKSLPALLLLFLAPLLANAQSRFRLTGYILNGQTNAPVAGANVLILDTGIGTATDSAGFFSLPLPKGSQTVQVSHQSYETAQRGILARTDLTINILLNERVTLLREATVTANQPGQTVKTNAVGVTTLSVRTLKQLPTLLGEVDVIRSIQLLPGVSSVGEASTGFNVRGGNTDQNLILLDDAPLFNSSHLLGFMSVFNPDVVQDVNFFRGSVPANFGGRAASVLQVRLKEAKATQLSVSGGLGLISSRLKVEAPIIRNKLAFYAAGRIAYADQLLRVVPIPALTGVKAGFTDGTFRADYFPNPKNKLSLTVFTSTDRFRLPGDSLTQVDLSGSRAEFGWKTQAVTLGWSRYLSARWQVQTTAVWSRYRSTISNPDSARAYNLTSGVDYQQIKSGLTYAGGRETGPRFQAEAGLSGIVYDVVTGQLLPTHPRSQVNPVRLPNQRAIEAGAYLNADITFSKQLSAQVGLRYSWFGQLGAATTYTYKAGASRSPETITDSVWTPAGKFAQTYGGLEPRLSVRYALGERASLKIGLSRMIQYLQQLSNTTTVLPADRWQVADAYLKPQIAEQVSMGYFQNLRNDALELSVEVFYKQLTNVNDYKGGTSLLLNRYPETAFLQGNGFARGVELFIRKNAGLLTGWISYTYSQTRFLVQSQFADATVNNGNYYPAPYDKPHILNTILNYKLSSRVSVSVNGVYASGRPITYPSAKIYTGGLLVPYFTSRNQSRLPDYVRFDIGLTINGLRANNQANTKYRFESDWAISLYNVLARRNAYSVYVQTPTLYAEYYNRVNAYKLSVLGSVIPSVSYNFRF
jgi:ferric enterobactin receptor